MIAFMAIFGFFLSVSAWLFIVFVVAPRLAELDQDVRTHKK
jgi:hypothetical protein